MKADVPRPSGRRVIEAIKAARVEFIASVPDRSGGGRDRSEQLWAAIDALPEKLRVTIVLASIEGHDVREVSALLGIPEGTVKSRLFLARQQLKGLLR